MSFTRHAFLRCLRCLISSAGLEGQVHFHWLVDDKTEYRARLLSSNQPSRTLRRDELAGCGVLPPPLPPLRIFLVPGTEIETLPVQGPRASFNHCQIRSNSARFLNYENICGNFWTAHRLPAAIYDLLQFQQNYA